MSMNNLFNTYIFIAISIKFKNVTFYELSTGQLIPHLVFRCNLINILCLILSSSNSFLMLFCKSSGKNKTASTSDNCGSFISQILPIGSHKTTQHEIFKDSLLGFYSVIDGKNVFVQPTDVVFNLKSLESIESHLLFSEHTVNIFKHFFT